jgi:hypothetical protein
MYLISVGIDGDKLNLERNLACDINNFSVMGGTVPVPRHGSEPTDTRTFVPT